MDSSRTQFGDPQGLPGLPDGAVYTMTDMRPAPVMEELNTKVAKDLEDTFTDALWPFQTWQYNLSRALRGWSHYSELVGNSSVSRADLIASGQGEEEQEENDLRDALNRLEVEFGEAHSLLDINITRVGFNYGPGVLGDPSQPIGVLVKRISYLAGCHSWGMMTGDIKMQILQSEEANGLRSMAGGLGPKLREHHSKVTVKLTEINRTLVQLKKLARENFGAKAVGEMGFSAMQSELAELIDAHPNLESIDDLKAKTESWIEQAAEAGKQLVDSFPRETWGNPAVFYPESGRPGQA